MEGGTHLVHLANALDNQDFDGDAMGLWLTLDGVMNSATDDFKPHKNMFDKGTPRKLSGAASIPKTVMINAANWYGHFSYGRKDGAALYDESTVDQSRMHEFLA